MNREVAEDGSEEDHIPAHLPVLLGLCALSVLLCDLALK